MGGVAALQDVCANEAVIHSSPAGGAVRAFCHFCNEIAAAIGKTTRQQIFTIMSSFVTAILSHLYLTRRALNTDPTGQVCIKKKEAHSYLASKRVVFHCCCLSR